MCQRLRGIIRASTQWGSPVQRLRIQLRRGEPIQMGSEDKLYEESIYGTMVWSSRCTVGEKKEEPDRNCIK